MLTSEKETEAELLSPFSQQELLQQLKQPHNSL
jgi:hypothetical protein